MIGGDWGLRGATNSGKSKGSATDFQSRQSFPRAFRHSVTQRLLAAAMDAQDPLHVAEIHRGSPRTQALARAHAALHDLLALLGINLQPAE